ncbi:hypothetical protein VNO77_43428 [Canavalia gladiata]|uniref:Trafficking protein particle complex subunit n=1 Tax=Canavalia gladiata TaxID=3824 RepID=A0AAN9PPX7_CANGL
MPRWQTVKHGIIYKLSQTMIQTQIRSQIASHSLISVLGMAAIYSLYIINKSGGLIYYKDYGSAGRMDTNDSLRVASLWHSMHAISQQLSPVSGCSGIELLQADTFDLHCFQSLTGTKFFVVCEPGAQHMENLLKFVYELYTDYVLKNPFYEMEMPIRCELFDINLTQAVQKDRVAFLGR